MILISMIQAAFQSILLTIMYRETAYLDPGSGSFLLQLLLGGLLGLAFVLKTYWRQFKTFVGRLLGKESVQPVEDANSDVENVDAS